MHTLAKRIDILQVLRGDTFSLELTISALYPLTGAVVEMQVRPAGDLPDVPVLSFTSEGDTPSITISGQTITLYKSVQEMKTVRPGRFIYDCQFTKSGVTNTLFGGIFQILQDSTLL